MKQFDIPAYFRSPVISRVKEMRRQADPRKKDYSPTLLDFGTVRFYVARHFGFCYGVENAIEISYRAVEENPGKRIFLLSEMIHNPEVNGDLIRRGVSFIMDTSGRQLIPWNDLHEEDVVIIPAFGTTLEIKEKLVSIGIEILTYDTTCPFVTKVWKRAESLGKEDYTVVVHGKHNHEETRATFSHSKENAATVVVRDIEDTRKLSEIILGERPAEEFYDIFEGKYSKDFDVSRHLDRVAVVNQTTMLATETQAIADALRDTMIRKYGEESFREHFADTRDTLCYATNDNQRATYGLLEQDADLAIIVGGYNSSNTSHLVELCGRRYPSYFISGADRITDGEEIHHYVLHEGKEKVSRNWLPSDGVPTIILTSGASCPDSAVDEVLQRILSFFPGSREVEAVVKSLLSESSE